LNKTSIVFLLLFYRVLSYTSSTSWILKEIFLLDFFGAFIIPFFYWGWTCFTDWSFLVYNYWSNCYYKLKSCFSKFLFVTSYFSSRRFYSLIYNCYFYKRSTYLVFFPYNWLFFNNNCSIVFSFLLFLSINYSCFYTILSLWLIIYYLDALS